MNSLLVQYIRTLLYVLPEHPTQSSEHAFNITPESKQTSGGSSGTRVVLETPNRLYEVKGPESQYDLRIVSNLEC